jgi:ATP-dependent HslUV protease, peptidase subunit HslV
VDCNTDSLARNHKAIPNFHYLCKKLNQFMEKIKSTTVLAVVHNGEVAIGADGQATMGATVAKNHVKKIRKMLDGKIITGFAGSTADAFTLLERFEEKLSAYGGNMKRASIELAKDWRTDRYLRRLEAMMVVANKEEALIISGTGDVLEPENGIAAIGSGSNYALSAALALKKHAPHLSAEEMVREGLTIAADICIYTNHNFVIEKPV